MYGDVPYERRGTYKEKIKEFYQEIKLRCGQYPIDFVEADINEGFREVLLPYLIYPSSSPKSGQGLSIALKTTATFTFRKIKPIHKNFLC